MITMNRILSISGIILLILMITSCKKETKQVFPAVVSTSAVSDIFYNTAISGGAVEDDGSESVTARGVCWSTSASPTIADRLTVDGTGAGQFESLIYDLNYGTLYHVRAYATNSTGTAYGSEYTFTTKTPNVKFNSSVTYGTLTDLDGNTYKTIIIGTQEWMAENLKSTKFNDGSSITLLASSAQWTNNLYPAYCWLNNNDTLYHNIYGAYYNWFAVSTGKLCPAGWHVPSDDEWQLMMDFLGGTDNAGSKIKETGANNWTNSNSDATNSTGFTALPSGMRESADGNFSGQGYFGGWWSTKESDPSPMSKAWIRWIHGDTTIVASNSVYKIDGFNVRCLKN